MTAVAVTSSTDFSFLDWDSSHFGVRIGRVWPTRIEHQTLDRALSWASVQARLPIRARGLRRPRQLSVLPQARFSVYRHGVTLTETS
jgi:hypothetical protein